MKKIALTGLIILLTLSAVFPVNASSITIKGTVDDNLFVAYDFEKLDPLVYDQAKINPQFNISTIPQVILKNFEKKNQTAVSWGLAPQTNVYDDVNQTIHISFFLGGSDIISFTINRTTLKRTYQVNTEWRNFEVNLTGNFSVDFAQSLAKPVFEWQKIDYTDSHGIVHPAYYENKQIGTLDMFFYLILPASASGIHVQGDTVIYEMPPRMEDQLLSSPFLILGALAVVLVIALLYRKVR